MICPKCGSEIKEQMLYCSVCGEEIKFVPDYDATVDDNIQLSITGVIEQIDMENNAKAPTKELISNTIEMLKRTRDLKIGSDKKKSGRTAIFIGLACIFIIVCVGVIAFNLNRYYSFDYQYEKALEEFDNSQYNQSIKTVRHALSIDDSVPKIKLLLVDNYVELLKYDEALAVLYKLLDEYPDDVNIYDRIAKIYETKGDSASIALLVEKADIDAFKDTYSDYAKPKLSFSLPAGNYDDEIKLSIDCESGCTAYYTTDGSSADNTKQPFSEPLILDAGEHVINAVCYNANGVMSDEISGTYIVEFSIPDMPMPSISSGEYNEPKLIRINDPVSDCKIYYTIDGDDPTEESLLYESPVAMYIGTHNYRFAAITDKGVKSEVCNLDITLNIVNLVDMGTAKASLEFWLASHGLNKAGATYKCEQAYFDSGVTYYMINEYVDESRTGTCYAVDVLTGMLYKAKQNPESGEYNIEPVIKPL